MIQLTQQDRSGWCVVGVAGRADSEGAGDLEAQLRDAVSKHAKVAADISAVDYISSAGLRALIMAARAAQAGNVEFAICSPTAQVRQVFEISGLEQILTIRGELPC
jgi:anti-sigma B factor antagonist